MPKNYYRNTYLYGILILAMIVAIGLFAPHAKAHASDYNLDATINSSDSTITFISGPGTNAVSGGNSGTAFSAYYERGLGTYPVISTPWDSGSGTFSFDGLTGIGFETWGQGPGNYLLSVENTTTGDIGWLCVNSPTGTDTWTIFECDIPDYVDRTTHVIEILDPTSFEVVATSSPVDVEFTYVLDGNDPVTGYRLAFRNMLTSEYQEFFGDLTSLSTGTTLTLSTSTTLIAPPGTYELEIDLNSYSSSTTAPFYNYVNRPKSRYFGFGFNDNGPAIVIPGYEAVIFDASSCELDWDLEFNVSDCAGYLFSPGPNPWAKYTTLTLANSFPFSYINQFGVIKDAVFANPMANTATISTTVEGFGSITFISYEMVASLPFADFLKSLIRAMIWFLLAYSLYRMIVTMHDQQTTHV